MTAQSSHSTDPGWDLSFLWVGAAVTAVAAGVGAGVTGVIGGWSDAVGVLVGAALVTAFFVVSGVVVAWAGRINDAFTLPAALGAFFVKALVLFAILDALPEEGWLDRLTLAWAVIGGALLWSGIQLRWVWTRQLYYVQPPAPPRADVGAARPDPEKPGPRG
ncbi:hypothetical protein GCM10010531_31820 [Blastococcus jejuensis]|uniref:ATP synthase protein I n=1 Tax=Blastococcus jejuensis TaxID=351224 RepID=A0ABP6PE14_9ACTN